MLTTIDHRIIGSIICSSIMLLSTIIICVKYKIRKKKNNNDFK